MIRITVWNENLHEKSDPEVRANHPNGLHETVAEALREDPEFVVRTATLDDPDCGLTDEVLSETDVLFWWGHMGHDKVPDEVVDRVYKHVMNGMGLVALHSAHHSKIFRKLMGSPCNLTWHDDSRERVFVVNPAHPIAKGIPAHFEIPVEECYGEPFSIPEPDQLVFLAWYNTGEVFRAGCCYQRGCGKIFYFQPGHETAKSFFVPEVRQIYRNGARWAAPVIRSDVLQNAPHIPALEKVD